MAPQVRAPKTREKTAKLENCQNEPIEIGGRPPTSIWISDEKIMKIIFKLDISLILVNEVVWFIECLHSFLNKLCTPLLESCVICTQDIVILVVLQL
jgi:hypothetical protein